MCRQYKREYCNDCGIKLPNRKKKYCEKCKFSRTQSLLKTCENCGEEVLYGSTSSLNHAIRNNKGCKNCVVELRAKKGVSNTNKSNFGNKTFS